MWLLDFYSENELTGHVGIEGGELVYSNPRLKEFLEQPEFKFSKNPETAIKEMDARFEGSFHCVPHVR